MGAGEQISYHITLPFIYEVSAHNVENLSLSVSITPTMISINGACRAHGLFSSTGVMHLRGVKKPAPSGLPQTPLQQFWPKQRPPSGRHLVAGPGLPGVAGVAGSL